MKSPGSSLLKLLYFMCDPYSAGYNVYSLYMLYAKDMLGNIFLLTGLRIYTGEYKAQGPTLCPTEGRALRGPRALYSPV